MERGQSGGAQAGAEVQAAPDFPGQVPETPGEGESRVSLHTAHSCLYSMCHPESLTGGGVHISVKSSGPPLPAQPTPGSGKRRRGLWARLVPGSQRSPLALPASAGVAGGGGQRTEWPLAFLSCLGLAPALRSYHFNAWSAFICLQTFSLGWNQAPCCGEARCTLGSLPSATPGPTCPGRWPDQAPQHPPALFSSLGTCVHTGLGFSGASICPSGPG